MNPTPPGTCNVGDESVVCTCHVAGSEVPTFQTFARIDVGEVPSTCTRT